MKKPGKIRSRKKKSRVGSRFLARRTASGGILPVHGLPKRRPLKGDPAMPKKLMPSEVDPSEIYPDPLSKAEGAAIASRLADIALAGDMPASRLFANLTAATERDVWAEVRREREEMK
jgi:hypothetical protein